MFPRRSCESTYERFLGAKFLNEDNKFNSSLDFCDLEDMLSELFEEENDGNRF